MTKDTQTTDSRNRTINITTIRTIKKRRKSTEVGCWNMSFFGLERSRNIAGNERK